MKSDLLPYWLLSLAFRRLSVRKSTETQREMYRMKNNDNKLNINKCKVSPFFIFAPKFKVMEALLISRRSPAKQFAINLCLLTSLILEEVQDALLILLWSSVCKQLQAIKQDGNGSLFYVALDYCLF